MTHHTSLPGAVHGSTENAVPELGGPNKTKGRNVRVKNGGSILNTGNTGPEIAGPENAGQENAGPYRTVKKYQKRTGGN